MVIFWLHYIVAFILLYHVLFCIYVKGKVEKVCGYKYYERTNEDKRLRHPLWACIIFLVFAFIPLFNLILFGGYILYRILNDSGDDRNPYYVKSSFTKEI